MKLYKYSELKTTDYWKNWQDSLAKKHGGLGERGEQGEVWASRHIQNHPYFSDVLLAVHHDDPYHQMLGIDFTLIRDKIGVQFVDVKFGAKFLYWNFDKRYWYLTIRESINNEKKATTHFLFISPMGDKWAFFPRSDIHYILKKANMSALQLNYDFWKDYNIVTNLSRRDET